MSELVDSSLEFGRTIRAAIREREKALAPVIEAYDSAADEADRLLTASELAVSVECAEADFREKVEAGRRRMIERDLEALGE